ncbi:tetratricopeptide repeat protein [Thalassococcus sp. S3]|uniref:tetratricopeptide repeat protein n=1 Tax=Thalassococcus sp. S3 TaxID=2017482 RepID=UPI001024667D|nr:tetratricopeptide repeat protein [Thalassococcus sp. S3]QBF31150.1 hypothetical protein CFI11_07940 [Thalassococcus sp. S3]
MKHFVLICALVAGPALAETCPDAPDHDAALQALIGAARMAPDQGAAQALSQKMWAIWTDAPDEQAQAMLDRGMSKRSSYDFLGAIQDFDRLVAYCPNYAEGYNQRAFVNYLRHDFAGALEDLDRAIALSPNHVAALSGRALTLLGLDRLEEARAALTYALTLNPWLSERSLIAEGGPLAPVGEDI